MTGIPENEFARMQLSHRDFQALQQAILQLYEFRDVKAFRAALPGILLKIVPGSENGLEPCGPADTQQETSAAVLALARPGTDFTQRDRLVLDILRPHLRQAYCNAQRASAWLARQAKTEPAFHLTPRESEVATWVARGKTNAEIAIILHANPRTIEKHVEKILEKLSVENRTTAAVALTAVNAS